MRQVHVSFKLSLNDNDEGDTKIATWIQNAIEENLLGDESLTELRVEDIKPAQQYQHETDGS